MTPPKANLFIKKEIKRKTVYKFVCGGCGKKRTSYIYERAEAKQCLSCEKLHKVSNQTPLFDNIANTV